MRLSARHILGGRGAHNVAGAAGEDPRDNAGLRAADPAGVGPETRSGVVAGLAFVRPYRSKRQVSYPSWLRGREQYVAPVEPVSAQAFDSRVRTSRKPPASPTGTSEMVLDGC